MVDEKLLEFATERQAAAIKAYLETGTYRAAAKLIGVNSSSFTNLIKRAKNEARRRGYDPSMMMEHPVAEPFRVKGTSTLINKQTGEPVMQWVKTTTDQQALEKIARETAEAYTESIPSRKPVKAPSGTSESLLSIYPIADAHLGMKVSQQGSEKPYDLEIAYQSLTAGIDHLVNASPPSKKALIVNLGDFFHSDNLDKRTRRSGHILEDAEGEWADVLRTGIYTSEYLIQSCLKKHEEVTIINAIGNHDDHSSYMLSLAMDCRYRDEPRVTVPLEYTPHHYYQHGANLIGIHHGHSTKAKNLPGEMAASMPKEWGETKYRWWFTGHIHQTKVEEYPGVVVETFRAASPRNNYARGGGYNSLQELQLIVLDESQGQIMRSYFML